MFFFATCVMPQGIFVANFRDRLSQRSVRWQKLLEASGRAGATLMMVPSPPPPPPVKHVHLIMHSSIFIVNILIYYKYASQMNGFICHIYCSFICFNISKDVTISSFMWRSSWTLKPLLRNNLILIRLFNSLILTNIYLEGQLVNLWQIEIKLLEILHLAFHNMLPLPSAIFWKCPKKAIYPQMLAVNTLIC